MLANVTIPSSPSSQISLCGDPSTFPLILAIILPIGCLASYLPQHYKIVQRKTHIGLNFFCYCGLALTNCCTLVAFLTLHWHETFYCCSSNHTVSQCLYTTLRPLQFIVSYVCAAVIVILYCKYFNQEQETRTHPQGGETWLHIRYKVSGLIVLSVFVIGVALGIGFFDLFGATNVAYSDGLSVAAAMITSIHWMPQVLETWHLESLGSLSLALLILQSVGCILTFVSVSKGGVIVGIPYLVASFMQFVLMAMSAYFYCRDGKKESAIQEGLLQDVTM